MLKEILSRQACAECRVCCVFDRDDMWEMPLIEPKLREYIRERYPDVRLEKKGVCSVFQAEFGEDGLCSCPMLTEKGCALGDEKPFDCRIWPFRVMRKGNCLLLTASPVCETVSALPLSVLSSFSEKIADAVFDAAKENPEMIKDYIDGYPVLQVRAKEE